MCCGRSLLEGTLAGGWSISRATKDSARVGLYHRIKACRADSLSDCFAFCLVFVSTRGFVGTHFSFEPSDLLIARSRKEGHQTSGSRLRHPLSGKIQNATSPRSTLYVVVCVYTPIIYCKTQFLERFFTERYHLCTFIFAPLEIYIQIRAGGDEIMVLDTLRVPDRSNRQSSSASQNRVSL